MIGHEWSSEAWHPNTVVYTFLCPLPQNLSRRGESTHQTGGGVTIPVGFP